MTKLCKDCKHYEDSCGPFGQPSCKASKKDRIDKVDGGCTSSTEHCWYARTREGSCGPRAKMYESREVKPKKPSFLQQICGILFK